MDIHFTVEFAFLVRTRRAESAIIEVEYIDNDLVTRYFKNLTKRSAKYFYIDSSLYGPTYPSAEPALSISPTRTENLRQGLTFWHSPLLADRRRRLHYRVYIRQLFL